MMKLGITGMTVSHALGCGAQVEANLLPKVQVDMVVSAVLRVIERNCKKGSLHWTHWRW